MRKIVMFLFVVMMALSAKSQVYVGGTVSFWHNDDVDATSFMLAPEVGYNLNEKWAVGVALGFAHQKYSLDDESVKGSAFAIAPYARYSYFENKVIRLFIDGGVGFSTSKVDGFDSVNGFEIGFKPGISIKVSKHFNLLAKFGFLGYRDDFNGNSSNNGYGFAFTSEDLTFGFHYEF